VADYDVVVLSSGLVFGRVAGHSIAHGARAVAAR
jgi:hypothetical protein